MEDLLAGLDETELDELFNDHQLYQSDFQNQRLVVQKAGGTTAYGQYKQCLRELYRRYRGVRHDSLELDSASNDAAELADKAQAAENPYEKRRLEIEREKKLLSIAELEKSLRDTRREFGTFLATARTLRKAVGDLSPERRAMLDHQMWLSRIRVEIGLQMFSTGSINPNTAERLLVLSPEERHCVLDGLVDNAEDLMKQMTWVESQPSLQLPGTATAPAVR